MSNLLLIKGLMEGGIFLSETNSLSVGSWSKRYLDSNMHRVSSPWS